MILWHFVASRRYGGGTGLPTDVATYRQNWPEICICLVFLWTYVPIFFTQPASWPVQSINCNVCVFVCLFVFNSRTPPPSKTVRFIDFCLKTSFSKETKERKDSKQISIYFWGGTYLLCVDLRLQIKDHCSKVAILKYHNL